jgi:type II secretory pathway pseudopilin PulG
VIASKLDQRVAAYTLVEILVGVALFGLFMGGLLEVWTSLSNNGINTAAYAARQGDQMRVLDYLKRDIRRASAVEIFDGATPVTGTTTFGTELRLTIPDYYTDTREEDHPFGTRTANAPVVTAGTVSYGTALEVRYYVVNGAPVRDEAGTVRTVGGASGAFALSFKRESSGAIRCRVFFDQPTRGGISRTLRRQVDTLCVPRFELRS